MRETIRRKPLVLLALLATSVMTSSCNSESSPTPVPSGTIPKETGVGDEIVATIGQSSITRQQLLNQLLTSYGSQTLRGMMLQVAVSEEARSSGIDVTDEELEQELRLMKQGYEDDEQFYESMNEQLGMNREEVRADARYRLLLEKLSIRDITVTQSEVDEYLEQHREQFQPRAEYQWAQIVVQTSEQADGLLARLAEGEDFAELARGYSMDEFTAEDGGNVGWVEAEDPFEPPTVMDAVSRMQIGAITGPIPIDQGYVIVRLDGRKEIQTKTEEEVQREVRRQLALGKAVSTRELEQELLLKYRADVKDDSLR
ncbi:peptidyl-prolyl cis-trans isomerase [Cohnella cholangitidis]|uniref:peptidylprolyl isomerase n=1 Tax=Cohnella cholangitidis TaxID=2598458 RepID=A0A7G5BZ87_9BACL|nr:peptidyl-prolyl cis-trans isomerase [Cohnella cholangitidis]QMV42271.1 peptidylprolyl isomerase [Cohnella cholangitidis]